MRTASPAATGFSGAAGSATTTRGLGSQVPPVLLLWLCLLYVFCTPLDVQMYGILQCPGVLGRGTFLELWMFYWLCVEGKRQWEHLILP